MSLSSSTKENVLDLDKSGQYSGRIGYVSPYEGSTTLSSKDVSENSRVHNHSSRQITSLPPCRDETSQNSTQEGSHQSGDGLSSIYEEENAQDESQIVKDLQTPVGVLGHPRDIVLNLQRIDTLCGDLEMELRNLLMLDPARKGKKISNLIIALNDRLISSIHSGSSSPDTPFPPTKFVLDHLM